MGLRRNLGDMSWNLDDILPISEFDRLSREVEDDLERFASFYDQIDPGMGGDEFKDLIQFDERLTEKIQRLGGMPDLMRQADQKSETAIALEDRSRKINLRYDEISVKLDHWLKGKQVQGLKQLDDANAERLFNHVPDLSYVLNCSRESAEHTLPEGEEKVVSMKDTFLKSALLDLRDSIENGLVFKFKPKGAKKIRTFENEAELNQYRTSPNPAEREESYRALFREYAGNADNFFRIYQAVVNDWAHMAELRGFKSSISMRNNSNKIPDEAIEVLLDACKENRGIFQDYFEFKARKLGVDKLSRFDIYAPLKAKEKRKRSFDEGIKIVLDTFAEFSPEFARKARLVLDQKHVDSHPRKNKRRGAFCATISPEITPYVLLNYTGRYEDISTLAHELGHAVHSLYANKHSISAQDLPLPLAETASTLSEMIVFERLLELEKDDEVRESMLSDKMARSFATILRQAYFVNFEILAHERIKSGTTEKELSYLYLETLREQFGDSLDINPVFRHEWACIPHIVRTPFYCYAYNFGELLSTALYQKYKQHGGGFVPNIEKILSYGGSEDPQKILLEVGMDMTSRKFWQGSFDVLKSMQKRLEEY